MSILSWTICFLPSISNSLADNFFDNSASSASFSANSFSNFSLLDVKFVFFSNFCFCSSFSSSILLFTSNISASSLCLFALLFCILSFDIPISEFIFSILFELSNPIFCIFSIWAVISSTTCLNSSLEACSASILLSSASFWEVIISSSFTSCSSFSLYVLILYINKPTSIDLSSSLKSKNCFALSDCNFKGSIFASISANISFIRSKFNFVCSNFFSDSCFLVLYLTIPAASSKMCLLSSDLLLKISSILPCPIML